MFTFTLLLIRCVDQHKYIATAVVVVAAVVIIKQSLCSDDNNLNRQMSLQKMYGMVMGKGKKWALWTDDDIVNFQNERINYWTISYSKVFLRIRSYTRIRKMSGRQKGKWRQKKKREREQIAVSILYRRWRQLLGGLFVLLEKSI